jgi:calmodulin
VFQVFDRNGDGYISKTELYQTMKELGVKLSMEDLNDMMRAADVNQDGRIDYSGNCVNKVNRLENVID